MEMWKCYKRDNPDKFVLIETKNFKEALEISRRYFEPGNVIFERVERGDIN